MRVGTTRWALRSATSCSRACHRPRMWCWPGRPLPGPPNQHRSRPPWSTSYDATRSQGRSLPPTQTVRASSELTRGCLVNSRRSHLENGRFCDRLHSPARSRSVGVQNPCPKSTSHNHQCQTVVRRSRAWDICSAMPASPPPTSNPSSKSMPWSVPAATACSLRPPAAPAPTAPPSSSSWTNCGPVTPWSSGSSTVSGGPYATWSTPSRTRPSGGRSSDLQNTLR